MKDSMVLKIQIRCSIIWMVLLRWSLGRKTKIIQIVVVMCSSVGCNSLGSATRTAKHAEHGVSGQLILIARGEFEDPPIEYLVGPNFVEPSFFGSSNQMGRIKIRLNGERRIGTSIIVCSIFFVLTLSFKIDLNHFICIAGVLHL